VPDHRDDSNAVTVDPDEVRRALAALEGRVATLEKRRLRPGVMTTAGSV
jgi:hypothetical protein